MLFPGRGEVYFELQQVKPPNGWEGSPISRVPALLILERGDTAGFHCGRRGGDVVFAAYQEPTYFMAPLCDTRETEQITERAQIRCSILHNRI
jgi:hypothetical protein